MAATPLSVWAVLFYHYTFFQTMEQAFEEVRTMSTEEKKIVESLAEAVKKLPDNKKEYLMGYAEGVNAMSERKEENHHAQSGADR